MGKRVCSWQLASCPQQVFGCKALLLETSVVLVLSFFFIVSLTVCIVSIWEDLLSDFIRRVLRLRWLGTHLSCWALVKVASPSDVAGSPLEAVGSTPEPHRRCPGTGATPWGPAQHRPESSARFVPSSSHPEWTLPSMDLQPAWTRTPCRPRSVVTLSLMTSDLPQ